MSSKLVSISVYLTPADLEVLRKHAEKQSRKVSNLVAHVVREWLTAHAGVTVADEQYLPEGTRIGRSMTPAEAKAFNPQKCYEGYIHLGRSKEEADNITQQICDEIGCLSRGHEGWSDE